jgi:hypothetical protein
MVDDRLTDFWQTGFLAPASTLSVTYLTLPDRSLIYSS